MTLENVGAGPIQISERNPIPAWGDQIDTLYLAYATRQQAI